jgi:hypothetical protein
MMGDIGLDAMGRVLRKVRKEGMKGIGHSYRKSITSPIVGKIGLPSI